MLEYIIRVVASYIAIVKTVQENSMLNARYILVEIQSRSSSVFELFNKLTVDCTEELLTFKQLVELLSKVTVTILKI